MKALISLIFLGAIIILGIMVGRGTSEPATVPNPETSDSTAEVPTNPESTPTIASTGQGAGAPTGQLFVLSQTGLITEIQAIDVVTKSKKTILSDKNSGDKIKLVSKLSRDGSTLVALLAPADDPAGQLVAIKTDGSGTKTKLIDGFISANPPVISPDQTKLALTSFSNAEPNFGFGLVLMNVDGSNKKELTKDSSGISHIAFSPDGKQLAFLKGAAATSSEVAVVTIANDKVETLYKMKDKIIEDFDWSSAGLLVMAALPSTNKSASQSEIYMVDPKSKNSVQVTNNSRPEKTPTIAPDGTGVAFIQYKDDPLKAGEVIVTLPDGNQPTTVGMANQILGWGH